MKKTCEGCRAHYRKPGVSIVSDICELGYSQIDGVPKEECPKPKTYEELLSEKHKSNTTLP